MVSAWAAGLRPVLAAVASRWLAILGTLAYGAGVWLRWIYTLTLHHPRHSVFGDGMQITELAEILADPGATQKCFHTIWPPGASAYLALHLVFDPTLGSAAAGLFALSCAMPLLIAHAARGPYVMRAGWIALAMASLHLLFVHQGAHFLFEAPFQFAVALALWASVRALGPGEAPGAPARGTEARWRLVAALVSGAAWGLAFCFRSNALPVAIFAGLLLGARWARRRRWDAVAGLGAAALGLAMVCAPIADRCTALTGRPCLGANNFAMNVALGHAPDVAGIHFVPGPGECGGGMNYWYPPGRVRRGYQGTGEIQGSIYGTGRILAWVRDRFVAAPVEFVVVAIGNSLDLLSTDYWPDDYAKVPAHDATVFAQVLLLVVLIPGLAMGGLTLRRAWRRERVDDAEALLVAIVVAVFLVSAASLGEARYRVPFDGAFILLAARAFGGKRAAPPPTTWSRRLRGPSLVVTGAGVLLAGALLAAAAHPATRLAAWLSRRVHPRAPAPGGLGTHALAEFAARRTDGSPWDGAGNLRFVCAPGCRPITIQLDRLEHASSVEISTDANDRYEMVFYRAGVALGRLAWGVFELRPGMRAQHLDVPAPVARAGFDAITIRPLYGDGHYSLGHVLLAGP